MRWLVDGYNVIRRAPELTSRERESLEAGRQALCMLLVEVARRSDDTFTVVFDGVQAGGRGGGGSGVTAIFSGARQTGGHVLSAVGRGGGGGGRKHRAACPAGQRAGTGRVAPDQVLSRTARDAAA